MRTKGTPLKDARRGCYMWIPAELSSAPGVETRCRYAAMLMAAFAGGNGLQVLLDQCALVVARTRQPDVMHVVVGEGHDGKTLVFVDHMRAVFGSGFGNCPCSMLQVEREFQVQGSNFVHAVWMACDEARRQQGVCEDLLKNYIGGGWLPLRKNHAQETTYGCWRYAGKVWCMNTADIPEIPTSEERSNARRFRCTYMRSRFVPQSEAVSVQGKVFAADARAKDFMSSGAAVWCFYHDFLFPHMKKFGVQACSDRLESPGEVSTTTLDTKWLLARMNRSSKAAQPEEDAAACPSAPTRSEEEAATTSVAEKIVRETHKMFAGQYFGTAAALESAWRVLAARTRIGLRAGARVCVCVAPVVCLSLYGEIIAWRRRPLYVCVCVRVCVYEYAYVYVYVHVYVCVCVRCLLAFVGSLRAAGGGEPSCRGCESRRGACEKSTARR